MLWLVRLETFTGRNPMKVWLFNLVDKATVVSPDVSIGETGM